MDDFQLGEQVTRQMPGASNQIRRAIGMLKQASGALSDPHVALGLATDIGKGVASAADAAAPVVKGAVDSFMSLGNQNPGAWEHIEGSVRDGTEPPSGPYTQAFKDFVAEEDRRLAEADMPKFPDQQRSAMPGPRQIRPSLEFPEASNKQFRDGQRQQAEDKRRRAGTAAAVEAGKSSLLRFPEASPTPQGADSMDRLMGRSAANGFPISDSPPRGFALPGHEPRNFSAAGAAEQLGKDRADALSSMAQELGVGEQNQFPSDLDQTIAAVRRASGKSPLPVDGQLTMPRTIAYPPPPGALVDAGMAPSFPPTPDEIRAREAGIVAAAQAPKLADGMVVPGLGTGVISPSASSRVATLARDARKQQESRSAEEAAAKLRQDAQAQQERANAERERIASEKAEKESAEAERVAAEQENQRRRAPMAGMGGVMISPAERMTADANVSGRYSGPVGSRSAPMAMSPQDVADVTGVQGSPADAMGATPDYELLADKMGLPQDMDPEERLEKARVFWGDQISRSQNSVVRQAQGGGFYFAPSDEAKDRYKQAGLRADARSIKTTYPRNQSGTQDHIEALDQAVANNSPQEIGQIRRALYDDRNTATAAFIRDRGRMQQITRNMTDPRLAPAALAESLKAAKTPQEQAEVYRQFGRADLADQIETRLSSEVEGERGRVSTERMHRLDDATKNADIASKEKVGMAGADAVRSTAAAKAKQDEQDRALEERKVVTDEKALDERVQAREAASDADARDRELKQWGAGDQQEAAAARVLAPILGAGDNETARALSEVSAVVQKHYANVKDMMRKREDYEGAEAYTLEQAGEELLRQAMRGHDPVQHPVLKAWVAMEGKKRADEAKKVFGWSQYQKRLNQYEAFRQGMLRIGIDETSPLFKEAMNSNGIAAPAPAGQ